MLRQYLPTLDATDSTGFRLRGLEITRIEAFTDAAFAFAVTMVVLSVETVPQTFPELIEMLKGVPAFLASLGCLMLFWAGHVRFSRRYGLDDTATLVLSVLLIAVMLVYIYPLRFIFTQAFGFLIPPLRTPSFQNSMDGPAELSQMFMIYGAGYLAAHAVYLLMYAHAARQADRLGLDELEKFDTAVSFVSHICYMSVGVASIGIAWTLRAGPAVIASGFVYAGLGVLMPAYGMLAGRRRRPIAARVLAARTHNPKDSIGPAS